MSYAALHVRNECGVGPVVLDIHVSGSIETKLHSGVPKLFQFTFLLVTYSSELLGTSCEQESLAVLRLRDSCSEPTLPSIQLRRGRFLRNTWV